jgi:predicted RNA-binding Zn ribbon-like protein
MNSISTVNTMTLNGGTAFLDFINSGYDRELGVVTERLHSYEDLLTLTERLDLFEKPYMDTLRNKAVNSKKDAEDALKISLNYREKLYKLFAAIAQQQVDQLDLSVIADLNQLFAEALRIYILEITGTVLKFSFLPAPGDLQAPVRKLLLSAYNLLREDNFQNVKQCARCSWLFLDKTKNHGKKWCSMEFCGNAQKTKRYYEQQKAKGF